MQPDLAPVDVERRYQATFVGLVVLAFALAGLWWWLLADGDAVAQGASPVSIEAPTIPGPTSFAEVETRSETPEARMAGGDDEIQLCGGHWIQAGPDGKPAAEALRAFTAKAYDEVSGAALASMAASASPRVQAAAHYYLAGPEELDTHREALARMALVTDDAQVYAWAFRSCRRASAESPGACMQVSAAQWARLDPENAEPWLEAASEARRHKDEIALDDAMYHVAAAERHQSGWQALAAIVIEHAPQDEPSMIGTEMTVIRAVGLEAAQLDPLHGVGEYCSVKAIGEANRRETCERIATVLAERSTTLIARSMGMAMGRRLGWRAERLNALADQREAEWMVTRLKGADPAQSDSASCAGIRTNIERVRAVAEFGEIETLRRDVEASGQSVAKLAAESRRLHEADVRRIAAAEAASAASAPLPATSATAVAQR